MVFVPEITTVNQKVQIGPETTIGTSVAASKLLECFDWTPQINGDVVYYRPTGHKYNTSQEENTEWMDITLGGNLDYTGVVYPLGGVAGATTAVAHGGSVTAKDWIFTPPTLGSIAPQTYTMEMGDSTRARKWSYGLFTDFGYKGTRKDFTVSGKMLAQPLSDGITLTASPTAVAISPVAAKHVNVYLDTSSGTLGTTILTRALSVDFNMTGVYGPLWVLNRATVGYTAHVDLVPQVMFKIKLEADANGMAPLGYLQTGTTYWIRVQALGAQIAADGPGVVNYTFQHDMAVKFTKPSAFQDDQGVYAIEWDAMIVEDPTWGKSQVFTITNLLATL